MSKCFLFAAMFVVEGSEPTRPSADDDEHVRESEVREPQSSGGKISKTCRWVLPAPTTHPSRSLPGPKTVAGSVNFAKRRVPADHHLCVFRCPMEALYP